MRTVTGVIIIAAFALLAGLALGYAARKLPAADDDLIETVNELLPQTQCGQCGFAGCRPYAAAVIAGEAEINLCPPGGDATIRRLARLLGRDTMPLANPETGALVAVIDESRCIGCFHCRAACPVDAIVGAHQLMHTVIAAECTGCELCVAPCPVDCIRMETVA